MKSRFLSGFVAAAVLFAPLAHAKVDGNAIYLQEKANVAVSNANTASDLAKIAAKNAEAGNLQAVNQNLIDAKASLAKTQSAYDASKKVTATNSTHSRFIEQARISVDKAQVAVNQIQELSTTMSTTAATSAGGTATAATSSTAAISGTTLAIGAVVVAGAATAIALGSSSGGSSSTPSH